MFQNEYKIIKKSGLFDENYYLKTYKDITDININPIKHYIKDGWKLGLNPSEKFDTNYYLETYSDVKDNAINPLLHFIKFGNYEGRQTHPENSIVIERKSSRIKKLIMMMKHALNNPHLIKIFLREIKQNGIKHAFNKSVSKSEVLYVNQNYDYKNIDSLKQLINFSLKYKKISMSIVHVETIISLGGVQRYLWFDTITLNENNIDSICIFKSMKGIGIIINNKVVAQDLKFKIFVDIVLLLIQKYNVILSIHHCINWKIPELEYFLNLEIPIITFFHDDFWLKTKHFNRLFSATDDLDDDDIYNSFYEKLINISEKLVFPSEFIANKFINSSIILEGYKNKVEVSPNLILEKNITNIVKRKNKKLKIAYLGYKAEHKGWNLFESLLLDKNIVDQYDIYHIGADDLKKNNSYTKVLANYKNQSTTPELLLKKYDIDIVLLFSKLEESYSYTMYEAIASQSCIVTSDCSGNISHIIEKNQAYGKIFSSELSVIDFFNDYNFVLDWTLKNPNKNEIITHHNSFILKYIKEGKQC